MTVQADPTTALAAISRCLANYNLSGDRMRLEDMVRSFAPDGVLQTREWTAQGRDTIARQLSKPWPVERRPTLVRHHLTTSKVELDGGSATGRTYFLVVSNAGPDHAGVYVDRLAEIGGEWLITHREVRVDWQSDASMFPPMHCGK